MNVWLSFIFYMIYRFIRFLIHAIQDCIIWPINGVHSHLENLSASQGSENDCQILSILYRMKLVDGDISNPTDFIWWHERFVNAKDILKPDPSWTLYTLDEKYAYFLQMPKPWPFYHAKEAPFVWMRQQKDAIKLSRMPFKAFCKFSEKYLEEPKGPVVYFSNAARSGTTLLTRVMQVSEDRICCFGEPDGFTGLTLTYQLGYITDQLAIDLLKAIIKFYCKTQQHGQTYLMKVQSNATRIVPLVKKAMPQVKHMFTYRRNTRKVLSSVEKMFRGGVAGDISNFLWSISPKLACCLLNTAVFEYELSLRFGWGDCLDQAILIHVAAWYYYYRCRELFDIPIIYFEDLIASKEDTLRGVFKICELPYDQFIGEALKEFGNDSQAGTVLSQDNMKVVKDTPLDEERVKKIYEMCDQLGVPRIEI